MKVRLLIILITVINLLNLASAELIFSCEDEVRLNSELIVSIDYDSNEVFDVKISIEKDGKTISDIFYEDSWKNSYYYIKEAFPKIKDFKIKPKEESENAEICVKLRRPGKTSFIQSCKKIVILPLESVNLDNKNNNLRKLEKNSENKNLVKEKNREIIEVIQTKKELIQELENKTETKEEIIFLNSNSLNKKSPVGFKTRTENVRNYIIYFLAIISAFLAILIALRKL